MALEEEVREWVQTHYIEQVPYPGLTAVVTVIAVVLGVRFIVQSQQLPLPPGPKGWPLFGSMFDIPKHHAFNKFCEWAESRFCLVAYTHKGRVYSKYGGIYHMKIGLQNVIVISDPDIQTEFLVKRSKIYSDRPPSAIANILNREARSLLMPYNSRWRGVRKLFASMLTPTKCDNIYNKWSEAEAVITCMDLIKYPNDLRRNLNRFSMSVVRSITYGKRAVRNDPLMIDFEESAQNFIGAFRPGAFIIEYMPWMLKLPKFMQPGVKTLEKYRDKEEAYNMEKWLETKKLAEKHPEWHTLVTEIKKLHEDPDLKAELTERQCAATAMEIIGVGTDTSAVSVMILINALLLFPECLKKVHEELDRVTGQDRYPSWHEQDKLPYLRGMIKELQRWRTFNPLSMTHFTFTEDEYNGYRIPKNSVIRLNTWAIHRDPKRYPDPQIFMPERFLNHHLSASAYANSSNIADRDHFGYGSGKRMCVGIHIAERNLWNMISRLVHTFNIEPVIDANGKPRVPELDEYSFGLVLQPPDFDVKLTVRSEKILQLLEKDYVEVGHSGKLDSWHEIAE
ncbi:cytochrome P450 [Xylogone sp. PMI_703]|nr:cytochrome P450 [Xylogone sp. PMI_703]